MEQKESEEVSYEITKDVLGQILEQNGDVETTVVVVVYDKNGEIAYKVSFDTTDIKAGNKLYLVEKNKKEGKYTKYFLTGKEPYTVLEDGSILYQKQRRSIMS